MPVENITEEWLKTVELPKTGRVTYTDEKLPGFAVVVSSTGSKTFYRVGRYNGKPNRISLETFPKVNVKTARLMCQATNADIALGKPPRHRAAKAVKTLGYVWEWYLANWLKTRKKDWQKVQRRWNTHLAVWSKRPLPSITRSNVVDLQTKISQKVETPQGERGGLYAANEVVELLRTLFRVANDNDWHDNNPALTVKNFRRVERSRYLQAEELPKFFKAIKELSPTMRDVMRLALFTGARRFTVMSMRWEHLNLETRIWSIPPGGKSKKGIVLPLSDIATLILEERLLTQVTEMGEASEWVFPSPRRGKSHIKWPRYAMEKLREHGEFDDLRMHDLRRTLGSWQANGNESELIISKSLGQSTTSATRIYARLHLDTIRKAIETAVDAIQAAGEKQNS